MSITLKNGDVAPDFTLNDQNGDSHTLSQYRGQNVLIYFYPKDNTPGCTKQACAIRDAWPDFEKLGIRVLGVSVDSVASHKKFEEKFELPFTLLADEEKEVVNLYGVWEEQSFMGKKFMGTTRASFLIDAEGKIAKVYPKAKPADHAKEVLADLDSLAD